jgi:integrative and conjugative element protein (TIGR02256 family)
VTQPVSLSVGQEEALADLQNIASSGPALRILDYHADASYLWVQVSVDCSNLTKQAGGLRLKAREAFTIGIPPRFPLSIPVVYTPHERWAGTPHVQWKRWLCLYRSPQIEWDPADGIMGYMGRLVLWLERVAVGQLDALGEPLHPPVAYAGSETGLVVIRADVPEHDSSSPWLGFALLRQVHSMRADVVAWRSINEGPFTDEEFTAARVRGDDRFGVLVGAGLFLPGGIGFEYPSTAGVLLRDLAAYGIDAERLMGLISIVAFVNRQLVTPDSSPAEVGPPLYVVVGTPTRGILGAPQRFTHLAVWRLEPLAERIALLASESFADAPERARIGREAMAMGQEWLASAQTSWCQVDEARPEIVTSRDSGSAASWLAGKRVLILGAGALGAPICEACVRAKAALVLVADQGNVHSGILVRQPYLDAEIGKPKAHALVERMKAIGSGTEVASWEGDVIPMFDEDAPFPQFDLVVDATANRTVRTAIERRLASQRSTWPALATVLIGHDARRGIATLSLPGATGASVDILRRLGLRLRTRNSTDVADLLDDFYTDLPRVDYFQPEPGCSDVTFIGSFADVIALAGQMFDGILQALTASRSDPDHKMLALTVQLPSTPSLGARFSTNWFTWPNDLIEDVEGDYEIRVNAAAFAEVRAEARRTARVRARRVETGGSLLGQIDSASRVAWIDEVSGPPPDSRLSTTHFEHGLEGVRGWIAARQAATARVSAFVGMWHTHPFNAAAPSPTDDQGMRQLMTQVDRVPSKAVLLIVGGDDERWSEWLVQGKKPVWFARLVSRPDDGETRGTHNRVLVHGEGDWWPGGTTTPRRKRPDQAQPRRPSWLRRLKSKARK